MTRVMGEFNVMHWDERPYDNASGQPTLTHAAVTHELTGDIQGEMRRVSSDWRASRGEWPSVKAAS